MAERKNNIYVESLSTLSKDDILPGAMRFIDYIKEHSVVTGSDTEIGRR